jgi:hypothetical protein
VSSSGLSDFQVLSRPGKAAEGLSRPFNHSLGVNAHEGLYDAIVDDF